MTGLFRWNKDQGCIYNYRRNQQRGGSDVRLEALISTVNLLPTDTVNREIWRINGLSYWIRGNRRENQTEKRQGWQDGPNAKVAIAAGEEKKRDKQTKLCQVEKFTPHSRTKDFRKQMRRIQRVVVLAKKNYHFLLRQSFCLFNL